jgi:hypothetical protein
VTAGLRRWHAVTAAVTVSVAVAAALFPLHGHISGTNVALAFDFFWVPRFSR